MENSQSIFVNGRMFSPSVSGKDQGQNKEFAKAQKRIEQKRRNYYIKKNFQAKCILKFCAVVLLGAVLSTGLIFLSTRGTVTSHFVNSQLCIHDTAQTILPFVIYANLITFVITLIASILVTLHNSHKIAGTLFRFEKDLERLAGGDLNFRFMVRRTDQLSDLSTSLNLLLSNLNHSLKNVQKDVDQAARIAKQEVAPEVLQDAIKQVQNRIETSFTLK